LTMENSLASIPTSTAQGSNVANAAKLSAQHGAGKRKLADLGEKSSTSGGAKRLATRQLPGWPDRVWKPSQAEMDKMVKGCFYCQKHGLTPIDHHYGKCTHLADAAKKFSAQGK
jgi:hypothetical protein